MQRRVVEQATIGLGEREFDPGAGDPAVLVARALGPPEVRRVVRGGRGCSTWSR